MPYKDKAKEFWCDRGYSMGAVASIALLMEQIDALEKDAKIGRLVRSKLTSMNGVPIERCVIRAVEIE